MAFAKRLTVLARSRRRSRCRHCRQPIEWATRVRDGAGPARSVALNVGALVLQAHEADNGLVFETLDAATARHTCERRQQ